MLLIIFEISINYDVFLQGYKKQGTQTKLNNKSQQRNY